MAKEVDECPDTTCSYFHSISALLYDKHGDPGDDYEEWCDLDYECPFAIEDYYLEEDTKDVV